MRNPPKEQATIQRAQEGHSASICGTLALTLGSEHEEQAALFQWAATMEPRLPALKMLFAVPNLWVEIDDVLK